MVLKHLDNTTNRKPMDIVQQPQYANGSAHSQGHSHYKYNEVAPGAHHVKNKHIAPVSHSSIYHSLL